jgi:hypothetical protein
MPENATPEDERWYEQLEQVEGSKHAHAASGLPAVHQQALRELARQIVREAGLQAEGQQETRELEEREERANLYARHVEVMRSSWDTQFEITKHTSAGSGVLLLGLGALVGYSYLA